MIYLIIAIVFLTIAHVFKMFRQKQFIEIYEEPNTKVLLKGLSIGYLLNFILPFKLGSFFRAIYVGKRMKNGISFSFATVIIDIILDFFTILIIYFIFCIFKFDVLNNLTKLLLLNSMLLLFFGLAFLFKKYIKKCLLKITGIFNEKIQFKLLKVLYYIIVGFKDMIKRINKFNLIIYTIITWIFYIASYYSLSFALSSMSFFETFNIFYSFSNLKTPTFYNIYSLGITWNSLMILIYIFIPIIVVFILSFLIKGKNMKKKKYVELLPQNKISDKYMFLKGYFTGEDRDYYKMYIKLNEDVAIIEDFSAGSNATTMLCSKDGKIFFRKYSFGNDAKKLHDQVVWINDHRNKLTLTKIENVIYKNGVCSYDMPYIENCVSCFNYVHTTPYKESWDIIKCALEDLDKNLHTVNRRKSDKETILKYIDEKVLKNIEKINKSEYIKKFLKYDYIYINGKKYHNLNYYKKFLNKDFLYNIFKDDYYSDIHGDFTIENIICLRNNNHHNKKKFYIIDPNTGNIHESPYLDYAKFLQSVHGGYEFFMNTKKINYYDNRIEFIFTKSSVYYQIFDQLVEYLENKFGKSGLESIFYHEVIHWLRLMPYKIEKNGERQLLFYAGLIMVLSDVERRFKKT